MISFGQIGLPFAFMCTGQFIKRELVFHSLHRTGTEYARHYFQVFTLPSILRGKERLLGQNVKGVMIISAMIYMYVLWQSSKPPFLT